jgi:tetratricopeptide (TPR) repeat protein
MADDGPHSQASSDSGGLTPGKRKRLQQCFEQANQLMRQENFDYANELFTQCVVGDPANVPYAQSYLANLKLKYNNNKKGSNLAVIQGIGPSAMVKKASAQKDWNAVIKNGLNMLGHNPWHISTLKAMATACENLKCQQTPLVYLKMALEPKPKDPDINRLCAKAFDDAGMYDQAITCWHRVEQAKPGDEEAGRAIASLTVKKTLEKGGWEKGKDVSETRFQKGGGGGGGPGEAGDLTPQQRLERDIRRNPKDLAKYTELAELYVREENYAKAEEVLRRAYEASNKDADIREKWEDVQLRGLRQQVSRALQQSETSGRPEDKTRYEELRRQFDAKDMEFCRSRVERYPNNLMFRYDLGERYRRNSLFNEAIAEFQIAKNDPRRKGLSILALGQCFTKIKQYRLAIQHYEEAIREIPDRDADNKKKALYSAGRLAMAMQDLDGAERNFSSLAGMDFNYRDVSQLLDKIDQMRQNGGQEDQSPSGGG